MTIDERIMFLVQSTGSLHQTAREMTGQIQAHSQQLEADGRRIRATGNTVRGLTNVVEAHEERSDDLDQGEGS